MITIVIIKMIITITIKTAMIIKIIVMIIVITVSVVCNNTSVGRVYGMFGQ